MKVLFWARKPCIRTYKEAAGLRALGVETSLACAVGIGARYPGLEESKAFDRVIIPAAGEHPHDIVEASGADVVHVAHPPDSAVRDLMGCGRPVVHDFHDLNSLDEKHRRNELVMGAEKDAAELPNGLVYVSGAMQQYVHQRYPNHAMMSTVVWNAAEPDIEVEKIAQPAEWGDEKHLVYVAAKPHWGDGHFRDLLQPATEITMSGDHLHVHSLMAGMEMIEAVPRMEGLHVEQALTGPALISAISRYDAGIIPHWSKDPGIMRHLDMSVPNKLFEYWQAGIPVYATDLEETADIVEAYNLGAVVDKFSDLPEIRREQKPLITMKDEAEKLLALYSDVMWH